ncbi:MAG: hypothetical protein HY330_03900 [Chloroflexi bacterium]|nr:hypothetical protein [Chloroflexota bacterium]
MPLVTALRALNQLKRRRVIRDYAVIGAVAAGLYVGPLATADLDITVLVDSDEEYLRLFGRVRAEAERMEGMHLYFGGVPVQMLPTTTKPLYADALRTARPARAGTVRLRVARPEHLVLLALDAFRPKDRARAAALLELADRRRLRRLLRRFDDEKETLAARLRWLSGAPV